MPSRRSCGTSLVCLRRVSICDIFMFYSEISKLLERARGTASKSGRGRTRNELELLVCDHAVVGVVAPGDLAAVEAVAEDTLDWLVDEGDLDVAAEA